ncbi:MAG: hypothetical protein K4445_08725, partial [Deltaproteobacteria bacterium]
ELRRQMKLAQAMFARTHRLLAAYDEATRRGIVYVEMAVNNLRAQIVRFLWQVSGRELSAALSGRIFAYTAMAGDIQSIGNHVQAISALAEERARRKIHFSACGEGDFADVLALVGRNLTDAAALLDRFTVGTVQEVIRREEEIDVRVKEVLDRHLQRFHRRECSPEAGPIFVEMLGHLERISDLCDNIAGYVWDMQ